VNSHPWQEEGVPWKTESAFWGWVRGTLRKGWARHPVKLAFINKYRIKVPNPNPWGRNAQVWGMVCERCGHAFPMAMPKETKQRIKQKHGVDVVTIEIDHRNPASSLRCKEDISGFALRLFYVTFSDLRPLCQGCHQIVTYYYAHGVTEEEAVTCINIAKRMVGSAQQQKDELLSLGFLEREVTNPVGRKQCYRKLVEKVYEDERSNGCCCNTGSGTPAADHAG